MVPFAVLDAGVPPGDILHAVGAQVQLPQRQPLHPGAGVNFEEGVEIGFTQLGGAGFLRRTEGGVDIEQGLFVHIYHAA